MRAPLLCNFVAAILLFALLPALSSRYGGSGGALALLISQVFLACAAGIHYLVHRRDPNYGPPTLVELIARRVVWRVAQNPVPSVPQDGESWRGRHMFVGSLAAASVVEVIVDDDQCARHKVRGDPL